MNIRIISVLSHHLLLEMFIMRNANIQSVTSQMFGVVGPLGQNFNFFGHLGFDV